MIMLWSMAGTGQPGNRLGTHGTPLRKTAKGIACPLLWKALPRQFPQADGYQNARDRAIVLLLYEMALAPEEVRALLWKDLRSSESVVWDGNTQAPDDQEQGAASHTPRYLHIDGGRAAQQRLLEISPNVAKALRDWRGFSRAQRGSSVVDGEHGCSIRAAVGRCRSACCFMWPPRSFSAPMKPSPRTARNSHCSGWDLRYCATRPSCNGCVRACPSWRSSPELAWTAPAPCAICNTIYSM